MEKSPYQVLPLVSRTRKGISREFPIKATMRCGGIVEAILNLKTMSNARTMARLTT